MVSQVKVMELRSVDSERMMQKETQAFEDRIKANREHNREMLALAISQEKADFEAKVNQSLIPSLLNTFRPRSNSIHTSPHPTLDPSFLWTRNGPNGWSLAFTATPISTPTHPCTFSHQHATNGYYKQGAGSSWQQAPSKFTLHTNS